MTTFAPPWSREVDDLAQQRGLILHAYTTDVRVVEILEQPHTLVGSATLNRTTRMWRATTAFDGPADFATLDEALVYAIGNEPYRERVGWFISGQGVRGRGR